MELLAISKIWTRDNIIISKLVLLRWMLRLCRPKTNLVTTQNRAWWKKKKPAVSLVSSFASANTMLDAFFLLLFFRTTQPKEFHRRYLVRNLIFSISCSCLWNYTGNCWQPHNFNSNRLFFLCARYKFCCIMKVRVFCFLLTVWCQFLI